MVRFHGHLPPKRARNGPPVSREDINGIDLHGVWYMVAAFKKEGIYSTISPYWGSHTDNQASWNIQAGRSMTSATSSGAAEPSCERTRPIRAVTTCVATRHLSLSSR